MGDRRPKLTSEHYKTLSIWFEKAALLLAAALVVQKIFVGEVNSPVVYVSAMISFVLYFVAYKLLIKS